MFTVGKTNLKIIWMFCRGIISFGNLVKTSPVFYASLRPEGLDSGRSLPGGLC